MSQPVVTFITNGSVWVILTVLPSLSPRQVQNRKLSKSRWISDVFVLPNFLGGGPSKSCTNVSHQLEACHLVKFREVTPTKPSPNDKYMVSDKSPLDIAAPSLKTNLYELGFATTAKWTQTINLRTDAILSTTEDSASCTQEKTQITSGTCPQPCRTSLSAS